LFLIKAGVPVKEAIYFVSQPLVRDYVEQQRLIGSTFAPMLGKAVDSRGLVKFSAMKNVIAKNFPTNILPSNAKGAVILDTADKLLEAAFKNREDKFFSEKSLLDLIEKSSVNPDIKKENKSLLLFLHYLKIEDQIKGITKIKMNANPDTNTNTTLSNIELSESTIEDLLEDEVLSPLINSLMKDSVISSFFNGPLALALSKPLFKLRYNKAFSNYIIDLKKTRKLDDVLKKTFGEDNEKQFINAFRNDFVSYIFQNALLKSKLGDTYMSYDLKEEMDVKNFESKYFGAYVKTNNNGSKTLFVNDAVLKLQFENNAWSTDDVEDDNPYVVLGLHQVDPMTFTALEKGQNFEQYKKFVIEREYLRSVFPKEDSQSKAEYEKFLAEKALDNTFNFYHLFNNADTAYGNRVSKIINEYPDLVRKFDVLAVLKSESNFDQTIFNLGIADRDINSTKANMYISNLKDLANPVVLKNYAKALKLNDADIKKITEVFSMLPIFAYLQSGINKSSYNLVPFVDYTKVIDIIQDAGNEVLNVLENDPERREYLLSDYLQKFEFANNKVTNPTKKEFKSYLTNFDINKIQVAKETTTQPDTEAVDVKSDLIETNEPNVFLYDSVDKDSMYYKNLTDKNSKVIFLHSYTNSELEDGRNKNFTDQSILQLHAPDMTVPVLISDGKDDNFANLSADDKEEIKKYWSKILSAAENAKEKGFDIALPTAGFGNPDLMPQDLFVYLSRELYEKLGYLNPGSLLNKQVSDIVYNKQGISDEEILQEYGFESDPFKCS